MVDGGNALPAERCPITPVCVAVLERAPFSRAGIAWGSAIRISAPKFHPPLFCCAPTLKNVEGEFWLLYSVVIQPDDRTDVE